MPDSIYQKPNNSIKIFIHEKDNDIYFNGEDELFEEAQLAKEAVEKKKEV